MKNEEGGAVRGASLAITGTSRQYRVSPNLARYKALLPPGDYRVIVRCHPYRDQVYTNIINFKLLFTHGFGRVVFKYCFSLIGL